jgi:PPOX class probable F420-dependent enzyme
MRLPQLKRAPEPRVHPGSDWFYVLDGVAHLLLGDRQWRPGRTAGMADLAAFAALVPLDHGLVVVSTSRADGSIQSSVVNAGVLDHPVTGQPVVGLVASGSSKRLANLRARPRATVVLRAGWRWAGVEGPTDLAGPDDALEGFDGTDLPALLRTIFTAAGGTHADWDEYDRVMADERRVAVFVHPERTYGSG